MATRSIDAIRDTIQQLHAALESFRVEAPEPLAAAVQDYAAAVGEVNGRLRAAHALLRQGRRADAVHACDSEPNALECVAELDYSDQTLDAWLPTLDELGIPRPQRIQSDLATELSAAYDVGHQLASLMRQHRLLAIGRGPLEERVQVLRRIIEIDPENPVWQEDLGAYEAVCKRELLDELGRLGSLKPAAVTQPIASRVKQLVRQLSSADWLDPLDGIAVRRAQAVLNSVIKIRAQAELDQLAVQLAAAHASGNLAQAGELSDRWYELAAHGALSPDHAIVERATRCLDWVTEERNRVATELAEQRAADDLRVLAVQRVPTSPRTARSAADKLRGAIMRLRSFPASPGTAADRDLLLSEAAGRLRRLEGVALWFWAKIGTSAVATIAIVAIAAGWVWRSSDRNQVVANVQKDVLDNWLANDKGVKGRTAWEKWCGRYPWLNQDPIAAGVATEVRAKVKDLEERADREARNAKTFVGDVAATIERDVTPRIAMVETFDPQEGSFQAILDARQTVATAVPRAVAKLDSAEMAIAFIRDQLGDSAADPLADELTEVRKTLEASKPRFDRQLQAVTARIQDQLDRDLVELDERLMGPGSRDERERVRRRIDQFQALDDKAAALLLGRLEKLVERERRELGVKSLISDLDRAARTGLADYLDAVAAEATDSETGEVGEALSRVAADRQAIEAAEKWASLATAWAGNLSCDQASAAKWRRALELAMETEPPPVCDVEETERLERLLACFDERDERETRHVERLRQQLEEPVMQPGVLVIQGDKGRYYTRSPEMDARKCFRTEAELGRFLGNASDATTPAPQVALGKEILQRLDTITTGRTGYEEGFVGILALFDVQSQFRNCDPILQCKLIDRIVDGLKERAMFEESEVLLDLSDQIANDVGDSPRWVDPENRDKDVARSADNIVSKSGLVAKVLQDYRDRRSALERRPAFSRQMVFHGWLDKREGVEELRARREGPAADGGLYVIMSGTNGFEFVRIGENRDGKPMLDHKPRLTFGQPVFLAESAYGPQGAE